MKNWKLYLFILLFGYWGWYIFFNDQRKATYKFFIKEKPKKPIPIRDTLIIEPKDTITYTPLEITTPFNESCEECIDYDACMTDECENCLECLDKEGDY
jgi:hypothetical protein